VYIALDAIQTDELLIAEHAEERGIRGNCKRLLCVPRDGLSRQ
jgi:hypothetical protein